MRLAEAINAEVLPNTSRYFQGGVKFRSICATCNNELLGAEYDPHLIALTTQLDLHLKKFQVNSFRFDVKLNRVLKAIAGHILAQRIDGYRCSSVRDVLCTYFNSRGEILPAEWRAYMWTYPYKPTICTDGAVAMFRAVSKEPVLFGTMKFFPIAFMFCNSDVPERLYPITRLDDKLTDQIDHVVSLSVNVVGIPPLGWPETPVDQSSLILHGDGSLYAVPRNP